MINSPNFNVSYIPTMIFIKHIVEAWLDRWPLAGPSSSMRHATGAMVHGIDEFFLGVSINGIPSGYD